jgi:DNA-binding response OmpR family regulator
MGDSKQILVVDDHFEMLEFLRSMLELSNPDYQVLGVPSAEEGLLELQRKPLQRKPFDLLITDVRLPGMSGFELARKVRDLKPDLPILMITAYASAQGRKEAEQLGVYRYFEKPLDTDALLAAVHATLYTSRAAPTKMETQQAPDEGAKDAEVANVDVNHRLQALLSDTGAVEALLVDSAGTVLFRAGSRDGQPVERLAHLLARSLAHSFELADELKSDEPFTIQYLTGEKVDLYVANIGRRFFLTLLFDAYARRGRIGTVWVFAQRAIKELREMLPETGEAPALEVAPASSEPTAEEPVAAARENEPEGTRITRPSERPPNADLAGHDDLLDLLEQADASHDVDLDAFWDEAATDTENNDGRGFSFDEAVRRGLLPPDLT